LRILYITGWFQHPSLRGPTRCYHFTRELSARHRIAMLAATNQEIPPEAIKEMRSYTTDLHIVRSNAASANGTILGQLPVVGGACRKWLEHGDTVRRMEAVFRRMIRRDSYDVILLHGKSLLPVIADREGLPVVLDFCDATAMRVRATMRHEAVTKLPWLTLRYLHWKRLEKKALRATPYVSFICERDREAVLGPGTSAALVPIGVDLAYWTRQSAAPAANSIVFVGVMDYAPNTDAALFLVSKILPRVRQACPDVKLFLVGRNPPEKLKQAAAADPAVTVTGFVEDVRPYLEKAAVAAAPLRFGSGILNKALEAMAMEVPLVATPMVAAALRVDGLAELPLRIADGVQHFAEEILHLLGQPAERARLAAAGRRFVECHYVWPSAARRLEELCLAAARSAPARAVAGLEIEKPWFQSL